MSPRDFEFFERRLQALTGMRLVCFAPPTRRRFFRRSLRPRLQELELKDYAAYRHHLAQLPGNHPEWRRFINAIGVNRTRFFRDGRQFQALLALLARRSQSKSKTLQAWSCACSSGEEAFSLAMILESQIRPYKITATDIHSEVLEIGKFGLYSSKNVRREVPKRQQKWFVRKSKIAKPALLAIAPRLRDRVTFSRKNFLRDQTPMRRYDVILCRNVLYYFNDTDTQTALRSLWQSAKPGALLLVSASDRIERVHSDWKRVGPSIYSKC